MHQTNTPALMVDLAFDRIGNRMFEGTPANIQALYSYPPIPPIGAQPRHMNALMSITAGQDSDARTYTSDGALATRAVMRTSANGTTQRLEAWGYSALSLPEWYSLRSDAAAAGSTCTPDATLAPQHLWRYRYGPQQEREQKREWENGTPPSQGDPATQPLHWTYWLLGADGKQLATYHGVQGATCGGTATDVALWPVEYAAYAPLGTRVITRSNGTKEIVLADHLGSSRVVLAQQGYIAQSTAYTAYGEISHSEGDGARTGYIGRFAEPEGSFNLHGVRFYDADAGSFTAVDPLWAKYAAWTPYQYAGNQPTVALDWNGDSVSIIIVMPSYKYSKWSLVGHIALNIDGTVYWMDGWGKVDFSDYLPYIEYEAASSGVVEITLKNVDQEKIKQFLSKHVGSTTKYNLLTNSCITLALDALRAGGVPLQQTNGLISPIEIGWLFSNAPVSDLFASNYQRFNEQRVRRGERTFYGKYLQLLSEHNIVRNTAPMLDIEQLDKSE